MNTKDKQPKDEFIYWNDEWNSIWFEDPSILTLNLKIIKNDKPDGRRYKK